jgi:hypothetical protein
MQSPRRMGHAGRPGLRVDIDERYHHVDGVDRQVRANVGLVDEQMPVVAVDLLHRCARIGCDDREAVELHVAAEQRSQNSVQERVRKHHRRAECAVHAHRDLIARLATRPDRIRHRPLRLFEHPTRIERAVARDIVLIHGLDDRYRQHAGQQKAAMLAKGGMRVALGLRRQLPARPFVRRRRNDPFHGGFPGPNECERHRRHGAHLHPAIKPVACTTSARGCMPGNRAFSEKACRRPDRAGIRSSGRNCDKARAPQWRAHRARSSGVRTCRKKMMRGPKPAHHKVGECNSDYSAP